MGATCGTDGNTYPRGRAAPFTALPRTPCAILFTMPAGVLSALIRTIYFNHSLLPFCEGFVSIGSILRV